MLKKTDEDTSATSSSRITGGSREACGGAVHGNAVDKISLDNKHHVQRLTGDIFSLRRARNLFQEKTNTWCVHFRAPPLQSFD